MITLKVERQRAGAQRASEQDILKSVTLFTKYLTAVARKTENASLLGNIELYPLLPKRAQRQNGASAQQAKKTFAICELENWKWENHGVETAGRTVDRE